MSKIEPPHGFACKKEPPRGFAGEKEEKNEKSTYDGFAVKEKPKK